MVKKMTHDEYLQALYSVNKNVVPIEQYQGKCVSIFHRCNIDLYEWSTQPRRLLSGRNCPMCEHKATLTEEQYISFLAEINPDIEYVSGYIKSPKKALHRCKICGHEWFVAPNTL